MTLSFSIFSQPWVGKWREWLGCVFSCLGSLLISCEPILLPSASLAKDSFTRCLCNECVLSHSHTGPWFFSVLPPTLNPLSQLWQISSSLQTCPGSPILYTLSNNPNQYLYAVPHVLLLLSPSSSLWLLLWGTFPFTWWGSLRSLKQLAQDNTWSKHQNLQLKPRSCNIYFCIHSTTLVLLKLCLQSPLIRGSNQLPLGYTPWSVF